ncbi:MAG: hypothetical protein SFZ23_14955 [Planctomycetota bacterium]|nr:hypothetical protein [Planctomycetota bacterium]
MTPELSPTCPRCEYDLRGAIETWNNECPLQGTCSECGFVFRSADLLRPDRRDLPKFVEHAKSRGDLVRFAFRTFSWLVLPWRFWSRVRMHHRVRLRPMLLLFVLVLATAQLLQGALGVLNHTHSRTRPAGLVNGQPPSEIVMAASGQRIPVPPGVQAHTLLPRVETPVSDYAAFFLRPFVSLRPEMDAWYVYNTTQGGSSWTSAVTRLVVTRPILTYRDGSLFLALAAIAHASWIVLVLVIPQTRRQAKVARGHVWRAATHPIVWLVALASIDLMTELIREVQIQSGLLPPVRVGLAIASNREIVCAVGASVLIAWIFFWWLLAIRRWQLRSWPAVWLVLCIPVIIAILGAVIVLEADQSSLMWLA